MVQSSFERKQYRFGRSPVGNGGKKIFLRAQTAKGEGPSYLVKVFVGRDIRLHSVELAFAALLRCYFAWSLMKSSTARLKISGCYQ